MFKGLPGGQEAAALHLLSSSAFHRVSWPASICEKWSLAFVCLFQTSGQTGGCSEAKRSTPYRPGEQGVKGVQPVVHVLLVDGLKQNTSVFCAHSKGVGRLRQAEKTNISAENSQLSKKPCYFSTLSRERVNTTRLSCRVNVI